MSGPPSRVTLLFEYRTPILSSIQFSDGYCNLTTFMFQASKASIEDSLKLLESENSRLSRDLEAQRQRNAQLENKVRHNETEAARMHRIIT